MAQKPIISYDSITSPVLNVVQEEQKNISITASVSDGGILTYQWYSSNSMSSAGTMINGENDYTILIPSAEVGTKYYYCEVKNTLNGSSNIENSDKIQINVKSVATYLSSLVNNKNLLVQELNSRGVSASTSETFDTLIPKVLQIVTPLQPATTTTLGGIKVGENLVIDGNGVLSAIGSVNDGGDMYKSVYDPQGIEQDIFAYTDNELDKKVDKIDGKGLSTNDFTTQEKEKLASLNVINMATEETLGIVKPDNKTIGINEDGSLSVISNTEGVIRAKINKDDNGDYMSITFSSDIDTNVNTPIMLEDYYMEEWPFTISAYKYENEDVIERFTLSASNYLLTENFILSTTPITLNTYLITNSTRTINVSDANIREYLALVPGYSENDTTIQISEEELAFEDILIIDINNENNFIIGTFDGNGKLRLKIEPGSYKINKTKNSIIYTADFSIISGDKKLITLEKTEFKDPEISLINLGFIIDESESDPDLRVTYTDDVLYYQEKGFSIDWIFDNVPFLRDIKPCRIDTLTGEVTCYLQKDNFNYDIDGNEQDLTTGDDVMIEFPKFFWRTQRIYENGAYTTKVQFNLTNYKVDNTYEALPFRNESKTEKPYLDKIYIGAYLASVVKCIMSSTSDAAYFLRSLSNQRIWDDGYYGTPSQIFKCAGFRSNTELINDPERSSFLRPANGLTLQSTDYSFNRNFTTMNLADYTMLQILFILKYKSTNSQASLGRGAISATGVTGGTETKGMNYGEIFGEDHVKFLGIEDIWGNYTWITGYGGNITNSYIIGICAYQKMPASSFGGSESQWTVTGASWYSNDKIKGNTGSAYLKYTNNAATTNTLPFLGGVSALFPGASNNDGTSSTYYCDINCYYNSSNSYNYVSYMNSDPNGNGIFSINTYTPTACAQRLVYKNYYDN